MTSQSPVVFITGAAGEIGEAVARALAAQHRLFLCDHPSAATKLASVAARLRSDGAIVADHPFDVTDHASLVAATEACATAFEPPLGLFNNAGVQGEFTPIHRTSPEDVAKVISINVIGAFSVLAVVGGAMVDAGVGGSVVNSASMAGVSGAPNMAAYSASKAAIIGLTKSAAKDLAASNIRVNAISPAFIGPGMMWDRQVELQAAAGSQYFPDDPAVVAEQMIDSIPLRRVGSTAEVADVVAFLLSDASSYVTGTNIEINGGAA